MSNAGQDAGPVGHGSIQSPHAQDPRYVLLTLLFPDTFRFRLLGIGKVYANDLQDAIGISLEVDFPTL